MRFDVGTTTFVNTHLQSADTSETLIGTGILTGDTLPLVSHRPQNGHRNSSENCAADLVTQVQGLVSGTKLIGRARIITDQHQGQALWLGVEADPTLARGR